MPDLIEPKRLCKLQEEISGDLAIKSMLRLSKLCASDVGTVHYLLKFGIDPEGCYFINGNFTAVVTLQCQRCLEEFSKELIVSFLVAPLTNEADTKKYCGTDSIYDPIILQDGRLSILQLIEDELILNIPIVPMHDDGDDNCKKLGVELNEGLASEEQTKQANPFQVLQNLKVNQFNEGK